MPEIGNLLVSLQMETAQFNKGIGAANNALTGLGRQFATVSRQIESHSSAITGAIRKVGVALAGMATIGAATAVINWAKGMADAAESAENLSIALGIPIRQFLLFQQVMAESGGSAEEAGRTLTKLSVALREALQDPASKAGEAFEQLGIKQAALKANSNDLLGVLGLVADAWQKMPEGPQKVAITAELLSARFRSLVPIIKNGGEAFRTLMGDVAAANPRLMDAHDAGLKVDDAFDKLSRTTKAFGGEALVQFASFANGVIAWFDAIEAKAKSTGQAIRNFFSELGSIKETTEQMLATRAAEDKALIARGGVPLVSGGPTISATAADEQRSRLAPVPGPAVLPGTGGKKRRRGGGGGGDPFKGLDKAMAKDARDLQRESIEAAEEELRIQEELFRRKEQLIGHDVSMDNLTKQEGIVAERKLLDEKWLMTQGFYDKKLAAAVGDADETRKLQNQDKLDYEKFLTERKALEQKSAKERHDTFKELFADLGGTLKSSFERIFDSLMEGTFKLKDAISSLLKDIGKKLISKGFDKLFDIGSSAFGKLFTAGLPGAQYGASFKVGGAGALDSQLVAFRASPGEMVNVNRPGETRGVGETIRIDLNPSEGWVSGIADQRIVTRSGQIIEVAVRQSSRTVQRNFAGMSAEAQARQL